MTMSHRLSKILVYSESKVHLRNSDRSMTWNDPWTTKTTPISLFGAIVGVENGVPHDDSCFDGVASFSFYEFPLKI